MADPNNFLGFTLDDLHIAAVGALGGVMRWITGREKPGQGALSILGGAICAVFVSPIVIPLLDPILKIGIGDAMARNGFSAFFVGIGGMGVAGYLIDVWSALRTGLPKSIKPRPNPDNEDTDNGTR